MRPTRSRLVALAVLLLVAGACARLAGDRGATAAPAVEVRVLNHEPGATLPVVACDRDGDGTATPATFDAGRWRFRDELGHAYTEEGLHFGVAPGDLPVCGDWDGDGRDDAGIRRSGEFHLRTESEDGAATVTVVAVPVQGGTPVAGDWDGDGRDTVGVFDAGTWTLAGTGAGAPDTLRFGRTTGDRPVVGDWDRDGRDSVGVVRGTAWLVTDGPDAGGGVTRFTDTAEGGTPLVLREDGVDVPAVARSRTGAPDPLVVHYYGDSLSHEAAADFAAEMEGRRRPVELSYRSGVGSAVCDWMQQVALEAALDPDVIVMAFGGNPGRRCGDRPTAAPLGERYAEYLADAQSVMATTGDATVVWVAPPPFEDEAYTPAGLEVRAAYEQIVAQHPERAVLADGGRLLDDGDRFATTLPCLPSEPCVGALDGALDRNVVRAPDGIHLCPDEAPTSNWFTCGTHNSGAHRYAAAIARPLVDRFGL